MSEKKEKVKPYGPPRFWENYVGAAPTYFAVIAALIGCGVGIKKLLIVLGWAG